MDTNITDKCYRFTVRCKAFVIRADLIDNITNSQRPVQEFVTGNQNALIINVF